MDLVVDLRSVDPVADQAIVTTVTELAHTAQPMALSIIFAEHDVISSVAQDAAKLITANGLVRRQIVKIPAAAING